MPDASVVYIIVGFEKFLAHFSVFPLINRNFV